MTATPLSWPTGWKRATTYRSARFRTGSSFAVTIAEGTRRVNLALDRLGCVGTPIISSNLSLKSNGLPYSNQTEPKDAGVAVYWQTHEGETHKVMAIDQYDRIADNLAAIAATLESMRLIERHGGAQILNRAFTGFQALADFSWRTVLGVSETDTYQTAQQRFRQLARQLHPDVSGRADTEQEMAQISEAWAAAQKFYGQSR